MNETFLLVDNGKILDKVFTNSSENAELIFKRDRDWIFSSTAYCISETDYITKVDLNSNDNSII